MNNGQGADAQTDAHVIIAIETCRTAALGGHVERCGDCGRQRVSYNSCRNRNCPKRRGLARAQSTEDREAEWLDVPYFHVVFTMPTQIEVIAFQNQTVVYDILFRAAAETLRIIGADPQGFFLPVRVLSRMFWALFLRYRKKPFAAGELNFFSEHRHLNEPAAFRRFLTPAWKAEWGVYAKRPFAGPAQVLDYVGRYTRRVAISNNRLVSMDGGKVCFLWKDYRDDSRQKTMTLPGEESIRRFLIHVSPDGFPRIRYFGFLGDCHRARKLALCRELLGMAPAGPPTETPADYRDRFEALTGQSLRTCPHCRNGIMVVVDCIARRKTCPPIPNTS